MLTAASTALGAFLDARELVSPVAFELARPFVERPDSFRVGSIEHLPTVAPHLDEADFPQYPEMLGDRRLRQVERCNNVADRTGVARQKMEDRPPLRFGDGVEHIRVRGSARHPAIICLYRNVSSAGPTFFLFTSHMKRERLL
jgi:hypothetical protein